MRRLTPGWLLTVAIIAGAELRCVPSEAGAGDGTKTPFMATLQQEDGATPTSTSTSTPTSTPTPTSNPTSNPTSTPTSTPTPTLTPDLDGGPSIAPPPDMLLIPGGLFVMGADGIGEEDERPSHTVDVAAFYLDRTEVTQSAYQACVAAKACVAPDPGTIVKGGAKFRGANKPVTGVSWFDAKAYCAWKGKRLPREAEMEKASRGTDARRFPWGNELPTPEITVFGTSWPDDVGTHPKGRGPYGHDDLGGNVWEWMQDDYDPYAYKRPGADKGIPGTCDEIRRAQDELRRDRKQGYTGSNPIPVECEKSIRGGAYNYGAEGLRSSNRVHHPGHFRLLMTGLRCAKDA